MSNFTKFDAISSLVGGNISGKTDGKNIIYPDGVTAPTEEVINTELARLETEYAAQEYARNRQAEYPSTGEQLDYIFHNGIAKWKTDIIEPVKTKYPKPS